MLQELTGNKGFSICAIRKDALTGVCEKFCTTTHFVVKVAAQYRSCVSSSSCTRLTCSPFLSTPVLPHLIWYGSADISRFVRMHTLSMTVDGGLPHWTSDGSLIKPFQQTRISLFTSLFDIASLALVEKHVRCINAVFPAVARRSKIRS